MQAVKAEKISVKKAECQCFSVLLNCGVGESSLKVPWTARRSNLFILKEISPEYTLNWCWSWNSSTLALWCEELSHWKRPWCWERLKAGGEGDDRGWEDRMASPTRWTWVWASSGSWWWTGKSGILQSTVLQRVGHDWVAKLNWMDENCLKEVIYLNQGCKAHLHAYVRTVFS